MLAKIIFRGDIDWLTAKVKEQTDARAVFNLLVKYSSGDLKHLFSIKIGNDTFRDKVEFNSIIKSCPLDHICYTFQRTCGYWVIIFSANKYRTTIMTPLCNNLTIDNYKTLTADRMFMTGYSAYCEGYELQEGFSMDNLDAPHWIPAGSTKMSVGGSFIISSFWVSLSYNRIA